MNKEQIEELQAQFRKFVDDFVMQEACLRSDVMMTLADELSQDAIEAQIETEQN